jgi:hypothetical protein
MTSRLLALFGGALALLLVSAVASPADARRGGHGFSGGRHSGHFHAGPRSHGPRAHFSHRFSPGARFSHHPRVHHRRFHRHRHIFLGAPFIYGGYYYADCEWMRRRALRTGSPYWWNRYDNCLYGYGY